MAAAEHSGKNGWNAQMPNRGFLAVESGAADVVSGAAAGARARNVVRVRPSVRPGPGLLLAFFTLIPILRSVRTRVQLRTPTGLTSGPSTTGRRLEPIEAIEVTAEPDGRRRQCAV